MSDEYGIVPVGKTWLSIQTETTLPPESINSQLLVLQTAFPTVVRNYDQFEFQAMQKLWYDIFKNVPELLMQEAIKRFIINDRKGFFPSPGQIIGYIEQIAQEQKEAEEERRMIERLEKLLEYDNRVKKGENCANCKFCKQETDRRNGEMMFCTNTESINYVRARKAGVTNDLCCELFCLAKTATKTEGSP